MRKLLLLTALILGFGHLQAEQLFILFDGTCGDRVQYEQAVAQQPRISYYSYHFPLAGGVRLMLETGAEGQTVQSYLPQGYVYCGDARLNAELATRIKSGQDRAFILTPTANGQYIIHPVQMASVLRRSGNEFQYESSLTGYQFDMNNGIIGENLSYNNSAGAKVYFEGRETSPCTGYFLFRQLNPEAPYPVIDYRISPEIGLIERRMGSDGVTTAGGVLLARTVNDIPVSDYIATICTNATLAARNATTPAPPPAPAPTAYGTNPVYTPPSYGTPVVPNAQPESNAYVPPTTVTSRQTHTVKKGETLFGISHQYGTTVAALQTENGMSGTTVYPGQQLTVSTTTTTSAPQPTAPQPYTPTSAPQAYGGTTAAPQPYAVPPAPQPYATSTPAPQPTASTAPPATTARSGGLYDNTHVVQPGETVASIALKYGYTSAKFREMNELGPNDYARVGQRLKTSDCNCPAAAAPMPTTPATTPVPSAYGSTAAPAANGTTPQPAAPTSYGRPAVTTPQPYTTTPAAPTGTVMPRPQPVGTPLNTGGTAPAPAPTTTAPAVAPGTTISNSPNFGQPVPNVSAAPSRTMSQMERSTPAPATYGQAPATTPSAATLSYPVPVFSNGQPATTPAGNAPATYGGTPVTNGAPANAPAQPDSRAFHIVQEGETVYSISQRYGLTTDQLRNLNGMRATDVILPYQKLYVQ